MQMKSHFRFVSRFAEIRFKLWGVVRYVEVVSVIDRLTERGTVA